MTDAEQHLADGLATALLGGVWDRPGMLARTRDAIGSRRAPKWLTALIDEVLTAYRDAPADRPRELAAYLRTTAGFTRAHGRRPYPRIVSWEPVPTTIVTRPWPVAPLPDLSTLARLLDLDQGELEWFADVRGLERSVPEPLRHYRWSTRTKRGGVRVLAAPKGRLKEIQRRLLRHVLEPIPVHVASHGGVRGRSVASAVDPHCGADAVVRIDLTSFYWSVRAGRVWDLLRTAGLPEAVAHTMTGLVTTVAPMPYRRVDPRLRTPHLPQGAPTSTALANLVAFSLDRRLSGLAERFGATYTRYVDDLVFSGGRDLRRPRFVDRVTRVVAAEGFAVNPAKTAVLSSWGRQQVLGAVLNDHATIPRHERDALRALLHNCVMHGWRSQVRGQDDFRAHVLGRIAWVTGLDPALGAHLRSRFDRIDWS